VKIRTRLVATALSLTATAVAVAVGVVPTAAHAASTCSFSSTDTNSPAGFFDHRYICSTYAGSPMYWNTWASAPDPLDDSGYMNRSSSVWVLCQYNGRANIPVSGNTNTWWVYTQGDSARANAGGPWYEHAWGWLPENVLRQGGPNAPLDNVSICPFDPRGG
jgi:hypothetical protein